MAKYRNRKNGRIATLVEEDKKCKTVLLEYEDGEEKQVSTSTLKRWWELLDEDDEELEDDEDFEEDDEDYEDDEEDDEEEVEDDEDEEDSLDDEEDEDEEDDDESEDDEEDEEELEDDDDEADDEDSAEEDDDVEDEEEVDDEDEEEEEEEPAPKKSTKKGKEKPVKDSKPKKSSVSKSSKTEFDTEPLQQFAIDVVTKLGGDYVQRKKNGGKQDMPTKVFRAGGHMFMHMNYSKYAIRMDTRGVDTEELVPATVISGFYDARYVFNEDTKEVRATIKKILTQAYKSQMAKNTSKEKKVEKKSPAKNKKGSRKEK